MSNTENAPQIMDDMMRVWAGRDIDVNQKLVFMCRWYQASQVFERACPDKDFGPS